MAKEINNKATIKIPRPLFEKLSDVIEGSGYNSVTDFVVYVLRDLVATNKLNETSTTIDMKEMDMVKDKLKALGYLN
jgi:metal-responsive CopG/Arc/MetJ family transcriptional regulator